MRYRLHDKKVYSLSPSGRPVGRTRDSVLETPNRRLIATYAGAEYVAEREGSELRVYLVGESDDIAALGSTTDHNLTLPQRLRNLNQRHREFYGKKGAAA